MSRVYRYSVWLYDDACYVQVFINKIYFLFLFGFKFSSNIKKNIVYIVSMVSKEQFWIVKKKYYTIISLF